MNCWNVLGMAATADVKAIKKRYAKLVKEYHPEDHPEEYQKIVAAYKEAIAEAKTRKQWLQKRGGDNQDVHVFSEQVSAPGLDFSLNPEENQGEVKESTSLVDFSTVESESSQVVPEKEENQGEVEESTSLVDFSTVESENSQEIPEKDEKVGLDFSHLESLDVGRISAELDDLLELRDANVTEQLEKWRLFFNRYKGQEVLLYDLLEAKDIYRITHASIIGLIYWYFQEAKTKKQYPYDLQKLWLWKDLLSNDTVRKKYPDKQLRPMLEKIYEAELFVDEILADENLLNDTKQWQAYFKQRGSVLSEILFDKLASRYHLITNLEIFDQWLWALGTKESGFYWMTEEREIVRQQMREHYYRLRYPNRSKAVEKLYKRNLGQIKVFQWLFLGIFLLLLLYSIFLRTATPWLYYALLSLIPYETFLERYRTAQDKLVVPSIFKKYWIVMGGLALLVVLPMQFLPNLSPIFFAFVIHWVYMRGRKTLRATFLKQENQLRYFLPVAVGLVVGIFFSLAFQDVEALIQIPILACFAWFLATVRLVGVVGTNNRLKTKYLLWPGHFVKEWLLPSVGAIAFVWLLSIISFEFFPEPYRLIPYVGTISYRPAVMVMCLALLCNLFLMGTLSDRIRRYENVGHLRMLVVFLLVILIRIVAIWYVFIEDIQVAFWDGDILQSIVIFMIIELFWIISYLWIKKEIKRNGDQFI